MAAVGLKFLKLELSHGIMCVDKILSA